MTHEDTPMNPKNWKAGQLVMLSCFISLADDTDHPECGRICKIISLPKNGRGDMVVEYAVDDAAGRSSYLILPKDMFLPVPEFCVEAYSLRPGHTAYRINDQGRRTFEGMGWPTTAKSFGDGLPATGAA